MPKIIENLREQLLAEAKKQILENGYAATTVRSVAGACGVGVGTVYNYFESKEMLIATFLYDDWKHYLSHMQTLSPDDPHALLEGIFNSLKQFAGENEKLFSDADALKMVSVGSFGRHKMLREQIASFLQPLCKTAFCAEFVAEAVIRWATEKVDFETVYPLLEKLIEK